MTHAYSAVSLAAAVALLLTGCAQTDFRDEADKREAFAQRQCQRYLQAWADGDETFRTSHINGTAINVMTDERNEPRARKDAREIYWQSLQRIKGSPAHLDVDDPGFEIRADSSRTSGCADTWLWEWTLHYDYGGDKYERFTWDDAVADGIRP